MQGLVVESRATAAACLELVLLGARQSADIHHSLQLVHIGKQARAGHGTIDSDDEAQGLAEFTVYEMLPIDLAFCCTDAVSSGEFAGSSQAIGLQHELHIPGSREPPHHGGLVDAGPFEGDGRRAGAVSPTDERVGSIWRMRSDQADGIEDATSIDEGIGLRTEANREGYSLPICGGIEHDSVPGIRVESADVHRGKLRSRLRSEKYRKKKQRKEV